MLDRDFPASVDFSRDILPAVIGERKIVAYQHTSFFEDLGSLKNYYSSHMALAKGVSGGCGALPWERGGALCALCVLCVLCVLCGGCRLWQVAQWRGVWSRAAPLPKTKRSQSPHSHTKPWTLITPPHPHTQCNTQHNAQTLPLQLFDKNKPIYTEPRTLPPSKLTDSSVHQTLIGEGCRVMGSSLRGCVIGACSFIDSGCDIQVCVWVWVAH